MHGLRSITVNCSYRLGVLILLAVLVMSACAPSLTPTLAFPTATVVSPTQTAAPPMPTQQSPTPQGRTLLVTSVADSGPGTLRQAMEEAQNGDTITFDPSVFPPDAPIAIFTASELPHIRQGNLTIDASDAGVILDGGNATGEGLAGLQIVESDANTIQGLQISNFIGAGIAISGNAQHNLIGGDRSIGSGPFGQGNMVSNTDVGIVLSTPGTSFNSITGNLIGTDAEGVKALGNRGGVWITEGAHRNTIGPNNVIAYNSESGIGVDDPETVRNTITRNSIHNNVWDGIYLYEGGNAELEVPIIWDFDLQSGTLTGVACANCIVEIFSDYGDEGAVYEGQAEADDSGAFAFEKGTSLAGPSLTATATDPDGNTTAFSSPTQGNSRNLVLQNGNALPMFRLPTKRSNELTDNRIGASFNELYPPEEGLVILVLDLGLKRVEVQFGDVEAPFDWSLNEYELPLQFDDVVDSLAENGIVVNYMLHFWDTAGHAAGEELGCPRFQNEEEVREFLDYVRFFVRHFKGRIPYYTIFSEQGACAPDYCRTGGLKCIMPEDYVELVRQVIPVIREEDPEARIVSGPNVLFSAREELFILLRSDVVKQLDVISWHPIYDVTPNNEYFGNYYYEYPSIIQEIKKMASAHGFQGEYWGTEISWCSEEFPGCHPADHPWGQLETDLLAAKYYARGIVLHLGMDVGVSVGGYRHDSPWSYPTIRNLNTVMAGNKPLEIPVEIESDGAHLTSYGFSLPNGDRLFAVWNDNVAVDYDPGIPATLTFPGMSAQKVIGIDVLHGLEQELIIEMEDGNLVIRNLLIKDYPIILRMIP